jgi:hypothetical protein
MPIFVMLNVLTPSVSMLSIIILTVVILIALGAKLKTYQLG